ncbi:hypothetical protein Rsub_13213 [Raphidocelis subcapitata]|uniref:Uncharacterized protein n=1 Tax=Raphidocelis subcapitata TaxID=307507 RepID=A0A2V0PKS2_9CHLO|nr:hypothetical protein Rsub_13213 [Raphidocelis subcapitata]|eukprot:GBG00389.1 hypothetical protein Rsub_13213 [Raphidocelis subcapitata]
MAPMAPGARSFAVLSAVLMGGAAAWLVFGPGAAPEAQQGEGATPAEAREGQRRRSKTRERLDRAARKAAQGFRRLKTALACCMCPAVADDAEDGPRAASAARAPTTALIATSHTAFSAGFTRAAADALARGTSALVAACPRPKRRTRTQSRGRRQRPATRRRHTRDKAVLSPQHEHWPDRQALRRQSPLLLTYSQPDTPSPPAPASGTLRPEPPAAVEVPAAPLEPESGPAYALIRAEELLPPFVPEELPRGWRLRLWADDDSKPHETETVFNSQLAASSPVPSPLEDPASTDDAPSEDAVAVVVVVAIADGPNAAAGTKSPGTDPPVTFPSAAAAPGLLSPDGPGPRQPRLPSAAPGGRALGIALAAAGRPSAPPRALRSIDPAPQQWQPAPQPQWQPQPQQWQQPRGPLPRDDLGWGQQAQQPQGQRRHGGPHPGGGRADGAGGGNGGRRDGGGGGRRNNPGTRVC